MRRTGPDRHTRGLVLARAESYGHVRCERCGARSPEQIHHRKPRRIGGTRDPQVNQPGNLVAICAACHLVIETHRSVAYEHGWLVPDGADPTAVAVVYRRRWVHLDDIGGLTHIATVDEQE